MVAGSIPDPRVFGVEKEKKEKSSFRKIYDPKTGTITQRALDRNQKTKLIISQIDEEDENEEETIDVSQLKLEGKTKVNSLVSPSPRNVLGSQDPFCNMNLDVNCQNNQPSIDLLINKLKQLE